MQLFNTKELEPYISNLTGNKVYPVKVDIKSGIKGSKQIIFSGGDINTATISILFYDDVELYDISNKTIVANIIKPDSEKMTVTGVPSGKYVEFNLGATGVKQEGIYTLDIEFVWDDKLITTPKFSYKTVLPVDISKELGQDENFPILVQLIMSVEDKIGEMDNKIVELESFKSEVLEDIDNYKTLKDTEITQNLNQVKTETKQEITDFKNAKSSELEEFKELKNSEIDSFKSEKDLEITEFKDTVTEEITSLKTTSLEEIKSLKENTTKEITKFKEQKSSEIDSYKSEKDKLIDSKILEVTQSKDSMVQQVNDKIGELEEVKLDLQGTVNGLVEESTATIQGLVQEADLRIEELVGYEDEINNLTSKTNEHSTRLNSVEYKNKVQDTYLNGLFNENKDGRLTINGEGNILKLEGSKEGIVEVESIEGNTLVNVVTSKRRYAVNNFTDNENGTATADYDTNPQLVGNYVYNGFETIQPYKDKTKYTVITNITENTLKASDEATIQLTNYSVGEVVRIPYNTKGLVIKSFTTNSELAGGWGDNSLQIVVGNTITGGKITMTNPIVLEGDFTSKPLPPYFEGMLSSFEEHKITEEDVREELELQDNLGKYKCNVKVIGKNFCPVSDFSMFAKRGSSDNLAQLDGVICANIPIDANKSYIVKAETTHNQSAFKVFLHNVEIPSECVSHTQIYNFINNPAQEKPMNKETPKGYKYITLTTGGQFATTQIPVGAEVKYSKIQVEEGSVATEYEPYTETNQVVYLNSPLLKGDKIVYKDNGLYHYHHSKIDKVPNEVAFYGEDYYRESSTCVLLNLVSESQKYKDIILCDKLPAYGNSESIWHSELLYGISSVNETFDIALRLPHTITRVLPEDSEDIVKEKFSTYLKKNEIYFLAELKEPTYEKILDSKFIVDIPNNATLSVDSIIPCADIKASYTGNIPSVYEIEETGINNSLDIEVTQQAVDFLLMSTVSGFSINKKSRGGSNMGAYFASRILKGALDYREVVEKYPEFKEDIDFILKSEGREDLIK